MSSATSIDRGVQLKQDSTNNSKVRPQADQGGFNVWHFFVLLSLLAATVAVLLTRQNAPESLILISLTIGAAGAAAAGLYRALAPLAKSSADVGGEPLSERLRADLEREKMLTLRSIKELEFDRAMGKVSPQDFDEMVSRLRTRAIGLMKQLDEEGHGYRVIIERELQARVAAPPTQTAGVCACGIRNDPDARFCKSCGTRLEVTTK